MKTLLNRTPIVVSTIALVIGVAGVAAAHGDCKGGEGKSHGAHMFDRLDTNKDGKITRAESKKLADERFTSMDTNKDGAIVEAEIKAAHEKMRAEWQKKNAASTSGDKAADGSSRKGPGHRGHHKGGGAGGFFAKLDTNKDGKVTKAEAEVAETTRFNKFDKNADGAVTREEAQAAHEAMKQARSAKKEAKAK